MGADDTSAAAAAEEETGDCSAFSTGGSAGSAGFTAAATDEGATDAGVSAAGEAEAAAFFSGGVDSAAGAEGGDGFDEADAAAAAVAAATADFCAVSSSIDFGGGEAAGSLAFAFLCSSVVAPGSWKRTCLATEKYLVPRAVTDTTNCDAEARSSNRNTHIKKSQQPSNVGWLVQ